jgi:hypothetical protein
MQHVVVMSGVLMGLLGQLMIWLMPITAGWRLLACVACLAMVSSELYRMRRAWARYSCARVGHDGAAALRNADGQWQPAELLPGCLLLRRVGWLRLRAGDGGCFAALYRGHCRHNTDWRRLQVIWRHIGAAR